MSLSQFCLWMMLTNVLHDKVDRSELVWTAWNIDLWLLKLLVKTEILLSMPKIDPSIERRIKWGTCSNWNYMPMVLCTTSHSHSVLIPTLRQTHIKKIFSMDPDVGFSLLGVLSAVTENPANNGLSKKSIFSPITRNMPAVSGISFMFKS